MINMKPGVWTRRIFLMWAVSTWLMGAAMASGGAEEDGQPGGEVSSGESQAPEAAADGSDAEPEADTAEPEADTAEPEADTAEPEADTVLQEKELTEPVPADDEDVKASIMNTAVSGDTEEEGPVTPSSPPRSPVSGEVQVQELEEQVNSLKEAVFRSKTRLALLKETVLQSPLSGSRAVITHNNQMGNQFRLEQVIYSLDGRPIFRQMDHDGDLAERREIELFNGAITPGNHNLSVYMVYRGHGYGIFSYLRGYVFRLRSTHAFNVEEGQSVHVQVIGYERGNITTDIKDRPNIKFEMSTSSNEAVHSSSADRTRGGVQQ